jgi:23S rRNA pseudouridine1911/1915/1917 synthase
MGPTANNQDTTRERREILKKKRLVAQVTISHEHAGYELAAYVREVLMISSRQLQRIVRTKGLFVNGRLAHTKKILKTGDRLKILLPESERVKITPHRAKTEILFEDEWVLAVNKQAGIPMYSTTTEKGLANAVAFYLAENGHPITPRPIHRLDTPTSGVVLFAKSAETQTILTRQWTESDVTKIYWALCAGSLTKEQTIDTPIRGKQALTKVFPVREWNGFTELRVQIFTGRTHQIRIHLQQLGHPIVGDRRYNTGPLRNAPRMALHAYYLSLSHPHMDKTVEITAPIPYEDFHLLTRQ